MFGRLVFRVRISISTLYFFLVDRYPACDTLLLSAYACGPIRISLPFLN